MNYKKKKQKGSGCKLCKPHKANNKAAAKSKRRRDLRESLRWSEERGRDER